MGSRCRSGSTIPTHCCFARAPLGCRRTGDAGGPYGRHRRALAAHSTTGSYRLVKAVVHRPAVAAIIAQDPVTRLYRTPAFRCGDRASAFTGLHPIVVAIREPTCCIDITDAFSKSHTATEMLRPDRHVQGCVRVNARTARSAVKTARRRAEDRAAMTSALETAAGSPAGLRATPSGSPRRVPPAFPVRLSRSGYRSPAFSGSPREPRRVDREIAPSRTPNVFPLPGRPRSSRRGDRDFDRVRE